MVVHVLAGPNSGIYSNYKCGDFPFSVTVSVIYSVLESSPLTSLCIYLICSHSGLKPSVPLVMSSGNCQVRWRHLTMDTSVW